ncbi:MAG: hypothetical protein AVDCRST_MAG59-1407 [uncultured Thermomicrobiales bacterium]|uniref:Uncharacterized protein n=1 Tax=uncultured Thermomicrobiales bacterium TaxID=1645740 RepID=A0A6J4UCL3_9BACT|nr:MAG: hypothetical protein AVDCRST_MAG59-1407 [uncultured Thermomicrobiales bacterium]
MPRCAGGDRVLRPPSVPRVVGPEYSNAGWRSVAGRRGGYRRRAGPRPETGAPTAAISLMRRPPLGGGLELKARAKETKPLRH